MYDNIVKEENGAIKLCLINDVHEGSHLQTLHYIWETLLVDAYLSVSYCHATKKDPFLSNDKEM